MNDDPGSSTSSRSWLDRLGLGFLGEPKDKEDLFELLKDSVDRKLIDIETMTMMEGVLQVSEMQVRDIMVPRGQVVVVDHDAKPDDFLPTIIKSSHSRFPVIGENKDEVIGLLLAKDLLPYCFCKEEDIELAALLRPVLFVPESIRLDALLNKFRSTRNHIAVVIDEYGGVAGIATIEDILEEIVGEIEDEHDAVADEFIKKQAEDCYIVRALTPIDDFNEFFKAELDDEEFDTIGGLVTHQFGYLPQKGESVVIAQYQFTVLSTSGRRIQLLQAEPVKN
ncbi:HlyC/CorC family transporter [Piscirickettsia salmonis]|uniref:HlyC/CorC family transporter n=1 Tax=Piscirickettsia salmonis TaxID=1238 RepID=UPI000F0909B9|nr:magnesium/cobalt efflux protein [Piscirickettsiaceae bacterium NZ-RLO2]